MGNSKSKHKAGPADDAWLIPQVGDLVDVRVPNGWTVGEVTKRHKNGDVSVTTNEIGKDSNNNDVYGITYRLNKAEHHGKMAAMGACKQRSCSASSAGLKQKPTSQAPTPTLASRSMRFQHKYLHRSLCIHTAAPIQDFLLQRCWRCRGPTRQAHRAAQARLQQQQISSGHKLATHWTFWIISQARTPVARCSSGSQLRL